MMDPEHIMQVGMGFFASKTLLSAVELGVFTELASQTASADELGERLGLHPRGRRDFFDGLVALGFLEREGDGPDAVYSNAADSALFLDRNQPTYVGGILEMANARLYTFWADLTEALRTGAPQNEVKATGRPMFDELYSGLGAARAVHARDGRHLRRELPCPGREIRLQPLCHTHRCRWRDRAAVGHHRAAPPTPALQ